MFILSRFKEMSQYRPYATRVNNIAKIANYDKLHVNLRTFNNYFFILPQFVVFSRCYQCKAASAAFILLMASRMLSSLVA